MTPRQKELLSILRSEPRGFDRDELARRLDTSVEGVGQTAASLVRRGLAVRFVGGVGPQRVHWQAAGEDS